MRRQENDELAEFSYSFNRYADGEWPKIWADCGIPAPSCEAIVGAVDMSEFNGSLSDWGSYSANIRLLGAGLADYRAALIKNGFAEPEDSYGDAWELEKRVSIGGKRLTASISDAANGEIPEIRISFSGADD